MEAYDAALAAGTARFAGDPSSALVASTPTRGRQSDTQQMMMGIGYALQRLADGQEAMHRTMQETQVCFGVCRFVFVPNFLTLFVECRLGGHPSPPRFRAILVSRPPRPASFPQPYRLGGRGSRA